MQYRIRELMILMAVLPPIGGWLWFAHNVPPLPLGSFGLSGFQHVRASSGFDIGAITVAVVTMGLLSWQPPRSTARQRSPCLKPVQRCLACLTNSVQ